MRELEAEVARLKEPHVQAAGFLASTIGEPVLARCGRLQTALMVISGSELTLEDAKAIALAALKGP